jgi:hypothetical protein
MKKIEENIIGGKIVESKSGYDEKGNYVLEQKMITIVRPQND